jgi:thiamine biosynthesis lipoprotein
MPSSRWQRRAQPWLGTLVEVGLPVGQEALFNAAFEAVEQVQWLMSVFDRRSDIARFNAAGAGASLLINRQTATVLRLARAVERRSGGIFDISVGSGRGWLVAGGALHKLDATTRLDLGGVAKGHAVDRAIDTLRRAGASAASVNAGGDLRCFGDIELPIRLRDELAGGTRDFASLRDGAFATSRRALAGGGAAERHVSVAAPRAAWADALTKVVALSGDTAHPLLARLGATAWLH